MSQITQEKFEELYKEYFKRLYGLSEKIVKDHHKIEDVVHEVFLRLSKQDFSKIEGHVQAWLFTVCNNCSFKYYHKTNRYTLVENIESLDRIDDSVSAPDEMMKSELASSMMKLIPKLSKNQQKALKLRYFENYSYDKIAKKMKLTMGNVSFMLSDAVRRLRILLDKENKHKGLY